MSTTAYANVTDLINAFGETECIALSDREHAGVINHAVLDNALARASAEIDSYLAGRYPTPWQDTPRILVGRCCDIAHFLLCGAGTRATQEIRDRYDDAIRYFEQVANGKVSLGRLTSGAVAHSTGRVSFVSGGKVFGRRDTNGGAF